MKYIPDTPCPLHSVFEERLLPPFFSHQAFMCLKAVCMSSLSFVKLVYS